MNERMLTLISEDGARPNGNCKDVIHLWL